MRKILHTDCMSSEESLSEPDSQDTGDTWGLGKKKFVCAVTSLAQRRSEHFNGPPWSKAKQIKNPYE